MWVAFANATNIFLAKILGYLPYLMIKVLAICSQMTSLVLNNWAQVQYQYQINLKMDR